MKNFAFLLLNRRILHCTGKDSATFLHRMLTNNITLLQPNNACYCCMLNAQSKFLYDMFIYCIKNDAENTELLIDINENDVDGFIDTINKFKLKADIKLTIDDEYVMCFSRDQSLLNVFMFKDSRGDCDYRIIVPKNELPNVVKILELKNITLHRNICDYDDFLISKGIVDGQILEKEKAFILEYNFEEQDAIARNKGCYVGQEMITRIQYTGTVRKKVFKYVKSNQSCDVNIKDAKSASIYDLNDNKIGKLLIINSSQNELLAQIRLQNDNNEFAKSIIYNNFIWKRHE